MQQDGRQLTNARLAVTWNIANTLGSGGHTVFANLLHNTGETFSADVVGDAQVVSNIEASAVTRAMELYWRYTTDTGNSDFLIGLWDLNSEFDVIEPAGLFLNSSHGIGFEFAQSGANGPSIFPLTSVIVVANTSLAEYVDFRAAFVDATPDDALQATQASDSHETNIEATIRWSPSEHISIQPNLQYVINPGFNPSVDNAVVVGARFDVILDF